VYAVPGLELSPIIVERIVERIPSAKLDERIDPERFTAREAVAHLADWEPIMRARIQAAAENPGSTVAAYDEGRMADDHGYANSDPIEQAQILKRERAITVEYVKSLTPEVYRLTAFHPERGEQTVEDFINVTLGHDLYHIEQLSAYL
jgi:hypothetical protein